jgi:HAD superfamily hydrolase (TIGR01509 family)
MGLMASSAVILDLDGTVWDSLPFYAAALAGDDVEAQTKTLAELAGAPAASLLKRAGFTKARFRTHCEDEKVTLYPGALRALRQLHERPIPLGAVTNLPAWMVDPMLDCHGLDELFGSIVTAGRAKPGKPHPAPLLLCCEELGVEPTEDCWYVGDSPGDCQAALAAGMSFAWASWGYGADAPAGMAATLARFDDVTAL